MVTGRQGKIVLHRSTEWATTWVPSTLFGGWVLLLGAKRSGKLSLVLAKTNQKTTLALFFFVPAGSLAQESADRILMRPQHVA